MNIVIARIFLWIPYWFLDKIYKIYDTFIILPWIVKDRFILTTRLIRHFFRRNKLVGIKSTNLGATDRFFILYDAIKRTNSFKIKLNHEEYEEIETDGLLLVYYKYYEGYPYPPVYHLLIYGSDDNLFLAMVKYL